MLDGGWTRPGGVRGDGGLGFCISALHPMANGLPSNHGHVGEDSDGVVGGAQGRGRRPTGGAPGNQEVTNRRVEPLRQSRRRSRRCG